MTNCLPHWHFFGVGMLGMAGYNNLFSNPDVKDQIERLLSNKNVHARHSTHRAAHSEPPSVQAFMDRLEKLLAVLDSDYREKVVVLTRSHRYKIYSHTDANGVPLSYSILVDDEDTIYYDLNEKKFGDNPGGLAYQISREEVLRFFAPLSSRVIWMMWDRDREVSDPSCPFDVMFYPPKFELRVPSHFK